MRDRLARRWRPFAIRHIYQIGMTIALAMFAAFVLVFVYLPAFKHDPKPCPTVADNAGAVAATFIKTAVTRTSVACSYDLVTTKMQGGMSRTEWGLGTIPVVPFLSKYKVTAEIAQVVKANGHRVEAIVEMFAPDAGRFHFWIILVRTNRWRVNYWMPLTTIAAPKG
jgi:hypothetical protein